MSFRSRNRVEAESPFCFARLFEDQTVERKWNGIVVVFRLSSILSLLNHELIEITNIDDMHEMLTEMLQHDSLFRSVTDEINIIEAYILV